MKNILILGAGLMQKPAILSAKEEGFNTIVIDADKNASCVDLADEFFQIDLKDREGILSLCQKLKAEHEGGLYGVFTAGTDFSASVSYVCEKMGLPSHSFQAALNASEKTRMRQCFAASGVPSPLYFRVGKEDINEELYKKISEKIELPFVVKPVDNMGARGCRMVRSQKEFLPAVEEAARFSRTGYAIIEEYLDGPEFSIDAIIYKGKFVVTGFAIRHIKYEPYFIEIGHTMPAILDKNMHDQLISVFALGAKAEGLSCGAAKADIKFTKKGPMIGEIAGRLSGGYMSGWTYPYASDLNLTKEGIKVATGQEPKVLLERAQPVTYSPSQLCSELAAPYELYEVPCLRTSAERAWLSIPGSVEYIENLTDYTDQAVMAVLPRASVKVGGRVDFPRNNVEKCGNIIAVSHDHDIAVKAAEDAVSNIFISLKAGDSETQKFLDYYEQEDEESFPPSAFAKLSSLELEEISRSVPLIQASEKISSLIPPLLKEKKYSALQDWNFNTIEDTARKFDLLRPNHPQLEAKAFWSALLRGGLQGAVYYSDTLEAGGK